MGFDSVEKGTIGLNFLKNILNILLLQFEDQDFNLKINLLNFDFLLKH